MIALSIVVPCFNEEVVLPETSKVLLDLLLRLEDQNKVNSRSQVCFVDDGSCDGTWAFIESLAEQSNQIHGLKLSRNCGHQKALLAGLLNVDGDVVISIDADLQDDVGVVEKMLDCYQQGAMVVYGVREERETDTWFKKNTANLYYRLLKIMGADVVMHHADFRLLARPALEGLKDYGEVNLFLRGIIPTIGFPSAVVSYARQERLAGESGYTLRKMLSLAIDGITSFSTLPLRMIGGLGLTISLTSLIISAWALWVRLFSEEVVPGWTSSVLPMYLLGGIQLFSIGVIGEYVSKIYLETKRRPRFIIEKRI